MPQASKGLLYNNRPAQHKSIHIPAESFGHLLSLCPTFHFGMDVAPSNVQFYRVDGTIISKLGG